MVTSGAIGFVGYFGHLFVKYPPINSADTAAWAGAIGTVGTLIGTIWLAGSAERAREREAMSRAVVAASSLVIPISRVHNSLSYVIDALRGTNPTAPSHYYTAMVHSLEEAGMWDDDEILPLSVLPHAVAANLAACRAAIDHCLPILRRSANESESTRQPVPGRAEMLLPYLIAALKSLDVAQGQCRSLIIERAPPIFMQPH